MEIRKIKVLIACEESQAICKEFRKLGVEAYSCDLQPCSGGFPQWHITGDCVPVIETGEFETDDGMKHSVERWTLIIAHPPCTFLTITGNRWFNVERYGDKARQRIKSREEAADFFMFFANADCDHIAIENPVGFMSTKWRKPDQTIQPYQYGDPYEKRTCLWLKGLPLLTPTNEVVPPARRLFKSGKSMAVWYADLWTLPKEERAKMRSKTFEGVALAMATQWCNYLLKETE